ncbi:MAG: hotdog fold domain-containing protein [Deltaproteobacteria bacterium]|nr:hotdog fold domain-containing protein [Deltaproteobacteria bacterium]
MFVLAEDSAATIGSLSVARVIIKSRFNGPPDSGNGGYVCGVVASAVEGPSIVTLRKPPPLERELILETQDDGQAVLRDGETVVGEAIAETLDLDLPDPPSFEEAVEASKRFPGYEAHVFPTCFVCGPGRPNNDGMNIFPGRIAERDLVASPWTPDPSMPNDNKRIQDEIVWAALDCTGYFPHYGQAAVLGRLHSKLLRETRVGERYVAVGWKIGGEGRKLWSGSAIFDENGNPCAIGSATWIALKTEQKGFKVAR